MIYYLTGKPIPKKISRKAGNRSRITPRIFIQYKNKPAIIIRASSNQMAKDLYSYILNELGQETKKSYFEVKLEDLYKITEDNDDKKHIQAVLDIVRNQ